MLLLAVDAEGDGGGMTDQQAQDEIMTLLRFDGPATVRAWFLGSNPHLADDAPADALHEGHLQDAMGAARSFVAYGANYG